MFKSNNSQTIQAATRFLARVCKQWLLLVIVSVLAGWGGAILTGENTSLAGVCAAFLILIPGAGMIYDGFCDLVERLLNSLLKKSFAGKVSVTQLFEAHPLIPTRAILPLDQPPRFI